MRAFLGIIVGIVVALAAASCVAVIGGWLFPTPLQRAIEMTPDGVRSAFGDMPLGARLTLVVAWLAGGFAAGAVAKAISRQRWAAWTVIILFALYALATVLLLPMPAWLQALGIVAPLVGGAIGEGLVSAAPPATPDHTEPAIGD
jgi:hypothetical protein